MCAIACSGLFGQSSGKKLLCIAVQAKLFTLAFLLQSIAHVAAQKNYFMRLPINLVIRNTNSKPIVKMTAKEFMMGYESPLTTLGNTLLPHWIQFDKVGLIDRVRKPSVDILFAISHATSPLSHQMYDFSGDFETFFTGETDSAKAGLYDTFRGSKNLPQWKGEHCSNIQDASDGTKFNSFLHGNETLKFFRKSMCRPQRLVSFYVRKRVRDKYLRIHFHNFREYQN